MIKELEPYDFNESLARITLALASPIQEGDVEMKVPTEDIMAASRQRKVFCTVMAIKTSFVKGGNNSNGFVAMKILGTYISEIIALLRSCPVCKDFAMIGDTIVSVFETPLKKDIQSVVDTMSRIHTLRMVIEKKANTLVGGLTVKMGMHFGPCEAYYIGSRISPQPSVLWGGHAVDVAEELLEYKTDNPYMMVVTPTLYNNLSDDYKKFFREEVFKEKMVYLANMYNIQMNNWINEH